MKNGKEFGFFGKELIKNGKEFGFFGKESAKSGKELTKTDKALTKSDKELTAKPTFVIPKRSEESLTFKPGIPPFGRNDGRK